MYVSGSLKNKTINFYRDKIIEFDSLGFETRDARLSYQGELSFLPQHDLTSILEEKQANYINVLIEKILLLLKRRQLHFLDILDTQIRIEAFKNTSQNITYALYECLYQMILDVRSNEELFRRLKEFERLAIYLNSKDNLSQVDLDIILELFLNQELYRELEVINTKFNKFHILLEERIDFETSSIIHFGEFVAPNRVAVVAQDLQSNNEFSRYVAPIYFALKSDVQARRFLSLCRGFEMDINLIEKNATRCRVPNNLIEMVRR